MDDIFELNSVQSTRKVFKVIVMSLMNIRKNKGEFLIIIDYDQYELQKHILIVVWLHFITKLYTQIGALPIKNRKHTIKFPVFSY